jgi:hypothetical protein
MIYILDMKKLHDIVLSIVLCIMIIKKFLEQYLFWNRDLFIELLSTNLKKIKILSLV